MNVLALLRSWPVILGVGLAAASWAVWLTWSSATGAGEPGVTLAAFPGESRTELLICVEAYDPGLEPGTRNSVRHALDFARASDPEWALLEIGDATGSVHEGCPGGYWEPPAPLQGYEEVRPSLKEGDLSAYRLAVFVVSETVGDAAFPGRTYGRAVFEMRCEGGSHVCWEVSTAVFVRESAISDGGTVYEALEHGLGIQNPVGDYPRGHPESEDDTPKYPPGMATAEGW